MMYHPQMKIQEGEPYGEIKIVVAEPLPILPTLSKDSLGDRMKFYEDKYRFKLPHKTPVIIRLDGKAFHTYTKRFEKPYSLALAQAMLETTKELVKGVQTTVLAYSQSDEISLLLKDWTNRSTQPWYDNNIQKMASVAASIATMAFNKAMAIDDGKWALFDARAFSLPQEEVCNYFIWRQQDAIRNSIASFAQSQFSQKELNGKKSEEQLAMLRVKGIEWDKVEVWKQRGFCVHRELDLLEEKKDAEFRYLGEPVVDITPPKFVERREYIDEHLIGQEPLTNFR